MQGRSDRLRREGKTIVLVPTMGCFHEGHLSLMQKGRSLGDDLVVSIFVNPTQFGPGEDFEAYPRDLSRDLRLAASAGADAVLTPTPEEFYGNGFQTSVSLEQLPNHLCGLFRPGHFCGVATITTKLFHMVRPHVAIFGEKDYQQLVIIGQLVKDLNFGIQIVGAPIVREPDGLAMSSQNTYLTPQQRPAARSLYAAIQAARRLVSEGVTDPVEIVKTARSLMEVHADVQIQYISVCHPETLAELKVIQGPARLALAVTVGKARLIDNTLLTPPS
jgi:pantoate--beta-alanine ligase